jgi:hypothetical protein
MMIEIECSLRKRNTVFRTKDWAIRSAQNCDNELSSLVFCIVHVSAQVSARDSSSILPFHILLSR